ncbi:MAG TPA: L-threonylcarbamoyladenylate synthase [Candidatus Cybelea sp.]|nr:L-threonylcarbamoyladenylate synthase [Candidatus Cybelea sp.]
MSAPRILPISPASIAEAARELRAGRLVAFPTETVYGLGGNAEDDRAVAAIFAAKRRPTFNPLIVHVRDTDAARRLAHFNKRAELLAEAFWPGALTLVLSRRADCRVSRLASAGLDTLAVRVPRHPAAHDLLAACGFPVAAPSANPSGRISPTTAEHVRDGLGSRVSLILDGGPCAVGLESTVIGVADVEPLLLRPGGIAREDIESVIGRLSEPNDARLQAPGMLASHYAPVRPLRLNAVVVAPNEALLAFGEPVPQGAAAMLNLSPAGDLTEAAANLFAHLHALDRPEFAGIAVMPIPERGLGHAINDRLRRAAAR